MEIEINSMAASQARGKKLVDPVFSVLSAAKEATAKYGLEAVVNATIGTIYDDREQLATFESVTDLLKGLPAANMMDYAPIKGIPGYEEAAAEFTFGISRPDAYLAAVATPGGTGGIRHIFYNYAEAGTKILIPDWYWGPYSLIAGEFGRQVETYTLFTGENTFNLQSLQKKVTGLLADQDNLVVVFNNPAHNPTGFSMSTSEWEAVLSFIKDIARDKTKKITLLLDVAYMDYAGEAQEVRQFFALFGGLPDNILVAVAFSMSKAFLVYGLRCGALIGISTNRGIIEEFLEVTAYSSRANWSNVTRLPQELLVRIVGSPQIMQQVHQEREEVRRLMENRAAVFMKEAQEAGLETCPYVAGFFASIPCSEPQAVTDRLQEKQIFVVPLKKGIRVGLCSVPTTKIYGLARKIKEVL